jgi:hypothetical protein
MTLATQTNPTTERSNGISIGIIGPDASVERIMKVIKSFPSFRPIPKIYESEEEAALMAQEIADQVEVLLLAGPVPYRRVREEAHVKVPVHYVPLTDTGFYRALLRLRNTMGPDKQISISIDTLGRQMVGSSLLEIEETRTNTVFFDGSSYPTSDELVSFHKMQYDAKHCDAAMTAERSVAQQLTKLNIPNEWVIPTDQNIVVALERALLSTETRQSKEAQVVVGLVNVDEFSRHIQNRSSEHEVQKFKLDIHRMLLDYVESLDGYLTHLGGDEYVFITTRGIFERQTGGYKSIPLAKSTNQSFGLSLSIGIGFGLSANEAGTHARSALRKSKEAGGNTCFIVREDRTLIGPLEMAEPVEYDLSLTDRDLIRRTEEAGMTSAYLSKLMSQVARIGKIDYKVQELADVLGITVRSTHRLLLQWIDNQLVDIVGVEKVPKGRPRQIFRLSFLAEKIEK